MITAKTRFVNSTFNKNTNNYNSNKILYIYILK